ncbi:MAG: helix-turn-helix domain-containing protein [Muribaculaceae bacterium]
MSNIFSIRLKQARIMRGLSMEGLCAKANNKISKQSISKYESGKMMPDSNSLILLSRALEVKVDYFFRAYSVSIEKIEFRKKSKLGTKQIDAIKQIVKDKLERYFEIEELTGINPQFKFSYDNISVIDENDVRQIASKVKNDWKLGEDGINNLIEILEENKIKVMEIDAPSSFDGLSGFVNEYNPVIVLNMNFCSERKRFTALHELGHLLLSFDDSISTKDIERFCNLFASEMLISSDIFMNKIGHNRHDISLKELIDIQKQFGISIDALMYKAKELNIITESRYSSFQKKKNVVEQFKRSVEESRSKEENCNRFVRLVYRALASEIISISKASVLLDTSVEDVRNQLNLV